MIQLSTWATRRARFAFIRRDVRGVEAPLASATKDGVFLRTDLEYSVWNPDSDISNYKLVEPDDFVIGLRSFQHGISHSAVRGIVSPAYHVLRAVPGLEPRYYKYYFRSNLLISQLANITQGIRQGQAIDIEAFQNLDIPVPPLAEQRRIADFLDAETARIASLISGIERQRRLLDERLISAAFEAISGIGRSVARRESGVRWLGSIPNEWPVLPVSHQFEVALGKMLNQGRVSGNYLRPYLRNTNVQWDRIDTTDLLLMDFPPGEQSRYRVLPGDLLICEGGEPGRSAIWDGSISEIYYQKALHRVRPRGYSSSRWLFYCMRVATAQNVFAVEGNSTTIAHLTGEQLKAHRFPFPPRDEQDAIVAELDAVSLGIRTLHQLLTRQVDLLNERRQALITAAVTGQIDVSTASGRGVTDGVL